jgi:hypothetical protein
MGENAAVAIFMFHSTLVMNFASHKGVYCAFPDLTFANTGLANPTCLQENCAAHRTRQALQKYRDRGFTITTDLCDVSDFANHECGVDRNCPATFRTLHDGRGSFFPFHSHEILPAAALDNSVYDGLHSVVWSLGGPICGRGDHYHDRMAFSVDLCSRTVRP